MAALGATVAAGATVVLGATAVVGAMAVVTNYDNNISMGGDNVERRLYLLFI